VPRRVDADEERRLAKDRPATRWLEIETAGGEIRRVEVRTGAGGEALAARADRSLAGTVSDASLRDLSPAPDDLRDRRVAVLPVEGIRSVSIETSGTTLRAWRDGDDGPWKVAEGAGDGEPADARKVEGWIDRLRWARAEGFETDTGFRAAHVVVIGGAAGEIGRVEIGDANAAPDAKVSVRSSFRAGVVLRVSSEAFFPVPATPADLAPDGQGPESP
jgi:hypothetical protein